LHPIIIDDVASAAAIIAGIAATVCIG